MEDRRDGQVTHVKSLTVEVLDLILRRWKEALATTSASLELVS